jgi:hypothetical protein
MTTEEERSAARDHTATLFRRTLGPNWRAVVAMGLDGSQVRRWFTSPKGRDAPPPLARPLEGMTASQGIRRSDPPFMGCQYSPRSRRKSNHPIKR